MSKAADEKGLNVEVLGSEPVVLADDEKAMLAELFGDPNPQQGAPRLSITPQLAGTVYRLRKKLGLEG